MNIDNNMVITTGKGAGGIEEEGKGVQMVMDET